MQGSDATRWGENFAAARAAAVAAGFERFEHVPETGSTNADLVGEARSGDTSSVVRVADHQTAGRGRLDRRWDDEPGRQLLVSFRLPAGSDPATVPGAVAVAAHEAVAELDVPVGIKWPNDLVVERGRAPGKLAGMLSEYVGSDPPVVVVGLGLNVGSAPADGATSLAANGVDVGADALLAGVLDALEALLGDPDGVRRETERRSATIGTRVRVERHGDDLVGTAVGIDADGRLEVEVDGVRHVVAVGDVVHLRPAH
ncbi:MAG: biotin--[acetyl-CoA-carboxylase] ligase [Actinomycetota bacterium]